MDIIQSYYTLSNKNQGLVIKGYGYKAKGHQLLSSWLASLLF